ncbi:MAG: hypothetical protein HC884_01940 [Chloroflexaceae bacterium]|nr:hypothetical protein [Chloroflexaceae bacterium]
MPEKHVSESKEQWEEQIVEMASEAAEKTVRFSLDMLSLPLIAMPEQSRSHARRALGEFAMAFMTLPREIASSAERVVGQVMGEEIKERIPRSETLSRRARAFTERLTRTVEEFRSEAEKDQTTEEKPAPETQPEPGKQPEPGEAS